MGRIKESKEKIKGAIVALVTPATPDYEIDLPRFRENVRFSMDGVKGDLGCLMAAGGGGEGYFLNIEQWKTLVKAFAEETKGEAPTMVAVFDLSTKHAIEKIKYAEGLGIDFIQLAPPHYEKPTDLEVYQHYKMINDAVSNIGIVVYHTYWAMPEDYEITLPLMTRITDLESVVGIKWASASSKSFLNVLFALGDKVSMIDNLGWVDIVKSDYGMKAFMCFIGNYAPNKAAELAKLFIEGRFEEWAEQKKKSFAHRKVIIKELLAMVHGNAGGKGEVRTLAEGTLGKTTCEIVGRPAGPPFPPQFDPSPQQKAELKARLEGEGLLSFLKS